MRSWFIVISQKITVANYIGKYKLFISVRKTKFRCTQVWCIFNVRNLNHTAPYLIQRIIHQHMGSPKTNSDRYQYKTSGNWYCSRIFRWACHPIQAKKNFDLFKLYLEDLNFKKGTWNFSWISRKGGCWWNRRSN